MRYLATMIIVLCCACASFKGPERPLTPAEIKANEQEFYKEFSLGNYDQARQIAQEKKVDRKKVLDTVFAAMWNETYGTGDVPEAKNIADKFQLDRATQKVFARDALNFLLRAKQCAIAADVAFYFSLDQAAADEAILCSDSAYSISFTVLLACEKPGTPALADKIKAKWLKSFQAATPSSRDFWPINETVDACSFTAGQYLDMYNTCLNDNQLYWALVVVGALDEKKLVSAADAQSLYRGLFQTAITGAKPGNLQVAKNILEDSKFVRVPADYDNFIASAISQFQCGLAATLAIEHNLPSATVEAIFLNRRCLGGTLSEIDPHIVPLVKRPWLFELSLRAREYLFARALVSTFEMGDEYFEQIVDEALGARDFMIIVDMEPPDDWNKTVYQWWILGRLVNADEEWFVTIYAVAQEGTYSVVEINWQLWVEQAYWHALRRGAFALAADIAAKRQDSDFTDWGVKLAFDHACNAGNLAEAGDVARRYHLGKVALRRVALLINKKNIEAEKKKKKQACQQDWNAKPCE